MTNETIRFRGQICRAIRGNRVASRLEFAHKTASETEPFRGYGMTHQLLQFPRSMYANFSNRTAAIRFCRKASLNIVRHRRSCFFEATQKRSLREHVQETFSRIRPPIHGLARLRELVLSAKLQLHLSPDSPSCVSALSAVLWLVLYFSFFPLFLASRSPISRLRITRLATHCYEIHTFLDFLNEFSAGSHCSIGRHSLCPSKKTTHATEVMSFGYV